MMAGELVPLIGHWEGHMGGWDGGWWIVMVIGMVIFWGLVIAGIFLLVRELAVSRGARQPAPGSEAMAVLDRRLAAGEIPPEEYRERRAVLRDESSPPPSAP
jgi:putative membrane protein